jgi:predicted ribosome quality control (RQC) complex YloA/Tae2 family protein
LEKAAEWAAYYSKAKSESLAVVIFTEKKYVRKLKGMPAGMVKTEKEKTIMIGPGG